MGSILQATCECGYGTYNLFLGGGMMDFGSSCHVPGYCESCGILYTSNLLAKRPLRCPRCRRKGIPYHETTLKGEKISDSPVFSWRLQGSQDYVLEDAFYFCPGCKQKSLRFSEAGNWD